jgi:hypothetical protein
MVPNQLLVIAVVSKLETYAAQEDFFLATLYIHESKAIKSKTQMPGAEKGREIKALLAKQIAHELKIEVGTTLECEIQKVAVSLWRIDFVITKKPTSDLHHKGKE